MLDFWQWAYSDLTDNVNRGVFAEWMVSSLLGIKSGATRVPWDAYDLLTPDGIRVEVKATAYVQAWTLNGAPVVSKPSSIRFTGLCGRLWTDSGQTQVADEATFNADVYVFCLQSDQDPSTWDALDLDQWEFYVLSKARVERNGCKTMGVSTLRSLTSAVEPERLREAVIAANAEQREN